MTHFLIKRADGRNGRKMSFHTGSRRSQRRLVLTVPLRGSRFWPGGALSTLGVIHAHEFIRKIAQDTSEVECVHRVVGCGIRFLEFVFYPDGSSAGDSPRRDRKSTR